MTNVTEIVLSQIHPEWKKLFFNSTDTRLVDLLDETIRNVMNTGHKLCPDHPSKILKCLSINPEDMKAVIVGQDPYPQPGIAQGTAFSCIGKFQPSLSIMVRELEQEYQTSDLALTFDGTLKPWVDQGVVLLNAGLTCEQWKPNSHFTIWQPFMTELFKIFNEFKIIRESNDSLVFVFLGKTAQSYSHLINDSIHYKIMRNHPAAEKHGTVKFEGFYTEVNKYLLEINKEEIKWY